MYTNVITLFVNIKTCPLNVDRQRAIFHIIVEILLYKVRNMEIRILKVLNDPMDEDDVIDTNGKDEINRFLQDTFSQLDHKDNLHDIHDAPLLEKSQ